MSTGIERLLPLKAYLLGYLPPDEQEKLEQQLMTDDAVFEELERVEYELIETYLNGALSQDERAKMESYFLSAPERQQQLAFARALRRYIVDNKPMESRLAVKRRMWAAFWRFQSPVPGWAMAAALLLMIAGASWSVLRITRIETALNKAVGDSQKQLNAMQKRNTELSAALQQEQNQRKEMEQLASNLGSDRSSEISALIPGQQHGTIFPLDLSQGRLRDIGTNRKVRIPPQANLVRLGLSVPVDDYPKYKASLQRVGGGEIWTQTTLKPLSIIIPSKLLESDDYILGLKGITADGQTEDLGSYYFRVVQK
jgi:hypothetical protein